jgi:hypothetical protein
MKKLIDKAFKYIDINLEDWSYISCEYKLSEDFIRKYQDKVDWHWISITQKLSLQFIEEFENKVDWYYISKYQKLNTQFIYKYENRIDFSFLIESKYLDKYSKEIQRFILNQIMHDVKNYDKNYYNCFLTSYMKEQYNRLSIML